MRSKTKITALHAWANTQPRYVITGGMNQKLRQSRGSRHEHKQQQQPWHMAHIHSHLPRHCAPQRKRPFCLLEQGVRKVSRVNRRAAPPLHPTLEKKRDGDRTSHPSLASALLIPASAHKHRLISDTPVTAVIVSSCYLIGSVCIIALKTSRTMTLLLRVLIASVAEFSQ